jgi:hypothetical protein
MRIAPLFFVVLACGAVGFAKKPKITVRFHVDTNESDGQPFAMPVKFQHPKRDGFVKRVPTISERNVEAIFPYPAPDGSFGCAFKLDNFGRTELDLISRTSRGASMVAFVGTKGGVHQVIDMVIDKVVSDGIITISSGLTPMEIETFKKEFKVLGETGKKKS